MKDEHAGVIYHVTTRKEWLLCEKANEYVPAAFEKEQFVHCCRSNQLEGVLDRYFSGKNDLMVLELKTSGMRALIRYESSGNGEFFPHVHGPIPKSSILRVKKIR